MTSKTFFDILFPDLKPPFKRFATSGIEIGTARLPSEGKEIILSLEDDDYDQLIKSYNKTLKAIKSETLTMTGVLAQNLIDGILQKLRAKKILSIESYRLEFGLALRADYDEEHKHEPFHIPPDKILRKFREEEEARIQAYKIELFEKVASAIFFSKLFKVIAPKAARKKNIYVLGGTGSGKSELMKTMIFSHILANEIFVIFDPHGKLASECHRLKELSKSTLYITPELGEKGFYATYNPLEHDYHDKPLNRKLSFISRRTHELKGAFAKILNTSFSGAMERLLDHCLQVLLFEKDKTLSDLLDFMRPAESERLEALAKKHPSEEVRKFFQSDFRSDYFTQSKQAILTRIEGAFSNFTLKNILTAKRSSFNLKKSLKSGKSIIFNLAQDKLGENGTRILGAFLLSEISTFALERKHGYEGRHRSIFLYLDECHLYLSDRMDKVLSEGRKYNLHITMANQYLKQFRSEPRLKDSIFANTAIKFCGKAGHGDMKEMGNEIGLKLSDIHRLMRGRFAMKAEGYAPIVFDGFDFLIKSPGKRNSNYLDASSYKKRLKKQLSDHYIRIWDKDDKKNRPPSDDPDEPTIEKLL